MDVIFGAVTQESRAAGIEKQEKGSSKLISTLRVSSQDIDVALESYAFISAIAIKNELNDTTSEHSSDRKV
jgi:phage gp37-like protein